MKRFSTFVLMALASLSMVSSVGAAKIPQHSGAFDSTVIYGCGCIFHTMVGGAIKLYMTNMF